MTVNSAITRNEALAKLQRFCVYQERCRQDVIRKLFDLGVNEKFHDKIIKELIREKFLNEARFAQVFVRGKFNLKKWGRLKIIKALKEKSIPEKLIEKGLKEIDDLNYQKTMAFLLKSKKDSLKNSDPFQRKVKAAKYAISKGYEPDLVWELLNKKREIS